MDRRFRVYSKPLSAHELFMGSTYLNPENDKLYTGRIPPYYYVQTEDRLREAGLLDRWPVYFENSSQLQAICMKYNVEKVRKCRELAGFEFLGAYDTQLHPVGTSAWIVKRPAWHGDKKPGRRLGT